MDFDFVFLAVFACVAGYVVFSMVRHGGFRGMLFGARVLSSVGEVKCSKRGLMSQKLKVHVLHSDDPATPAVGLEVTSSAPGSWSTSPIKLSGADVRELITLLERALDPALRVGRP